MTDQQKIELFKAEIKSLFGPTYPNVTEGKSKYGSRIRMEASHGGRKIWIEAVETVITKATSAESIKAYAKRKYQSIANLERQADTRVNPID